MSRNRTTGFLTWLNLYGVNSALMGFWIGLPHHRWGRAFFLLLILLLFLSQGNSWALASSLGLDFGFETQAYQPGTVPETFPVASAGLHFGDKKSEGMGDLKVRISPNHPKAFAITSKNLYWGQIESNSPGSIHFSVGRRLVGWAKADSLWNLGQFENLDQWDRLRPSMQGLTGVFAHVNTRYLEFRMFASGLFVPEITPNVILENQAFAQEHPQAIASAPKTLNLLNQPTPLGYNLVLPPINTLILRPSFAISAETRSRSGLGAKISYGYLPLNYFPIALQAQYSVNLNQVAVDLQPRLVQHHLYNGELSYRSGPHFALGVAGLIDQPVQDEIPSDYTTTPLTLSSTWTPWIEFRNDALSLTLTQIWVLGGIEPDVGPFASQSGSLFSSRMLYRNATQVGLNYHLFPGNLHDPQIQFKYIHEFSINGDWISGDFNYSFSPSFGAVVGGDILSSYLDVSPDRGAEFLADMRPLGRIRLGVTYAL
jgi:hypothetical protein